MRLESETAMTEEASSTYRVRQIRASTGWLGDLSYAIAEFFRYRELVSYLITTELRVRYRGSILGFLWTLMNPLLQALVMWAVFSRFGKIEEKNYALFLLSGIMVWTFFSQSIAQSLNSIIKNRQLIQKIYVPKLVFPIATVTSNLVNLFFFLVAYLGIALATPVGWSWTILLIVPVSLVIFAMTAGSALFLASLNVFFRDFTHLTEVLLRVLFYLTPIIYPPTLFGPDIAELLKLNPVASPVLLAREVLYYHQMPSPELWLQSIGMSLVVFFGGLFVFTRTQEKFVYYA